MRDGKERARAGLTVQIPDLQGSDLWELAAHQGWVAMKLYSDARGGPTSPGQGVWRT